MLTMQTRMTQALVHDNKYKLEREEFEDPKAVISP